MTGLPSPSLPASWTPPQPAAPAARPAAAPGFRLDAPGAEPAPAPSDMLLDALSNAICPEALLATLNNLAPCAAVETAGSAPAELPAIGATPELISGPAGAAAGRDPIRAPSVRPPDAPAPTAPRQSQALDTPEATTALAERIAWLADAGRCEARIDLHPQELGALQIRIEVRGEDTHVWFHAERPAARAALANALPQLRQMLAAGRLNLARAEVGELTPSAEGGEGEGFAARRTARRYVVGILDELA